jgi:hypothetical protein
VLVHGTNTLTVHGVAVTIDATALSLPHVVVNHAIEPATNAAFTFTGLPGGAFVNDPITGAVIVFTLNADQTVSYDASLEGIFTGNGTNTLTVHGVSVTIDATALSQQTSTYTLSSEITASTGCSGGHNEGPTSTVSGKVLVGGRAVTTGQINFFSESQQQSGVGIINPDGTYTVTNAPTGKDKVTISVPTSTKAAAPKSLISKSGPTPVAVPDRYRNAATTEIRVDVAPGKQTVDIALKDR